MKAGLLIFASFLCTGFPFQPSSAALRQLFEDALARRRSQFGDDDIRTVQAARDLGLFLRNLGDASGARRALAEVVRIDERVLGPKAAQTLADVAELAGMSPPPEAEPLWQRAAQSSNAALASGHWRPWVNCMRLPAIPLGCRFFGARSRRKWMPTARKALWSPRG